MKKHLIEVIETMYNRKVFHRFIIDNWFPVEYHQELANEWFETEKGQWVKGHCINIQIFKSYDISLDRYQYCISAYIKPEDYTFYKLKFST